MLEANGLELNDMLSTKVANKESYSLEMIIWTGAYARVYTRITIRNIEITRDSSRVIKRKLGRGVKVK